MNTEANAGHLRLPAADDAPSSGAASNKPRRGSGFRPDVQGLRAVAVALVVSCHLTGWPVGGFIGVDVFFVISGFLITGLLVRQFGREGRVDLREFYARRMRRIFPMAVVVLLCTVVAAYAVLSLARADRTLVDSLYAFAFVENWHLAAVGTDYFHLTDAVSPVQQYWSLSVEEQFYLVWPLGLGVLAAAAVRRRHSVGAWLGPALWVTVLGGFAFAVWQSDTSPTVAYFSTFTRVWELGAGALLAVGAARLPDWHPRTRALLAVGGLTVIVLGALTITPTSGFPGPWGAVPVLGTLAVLAAAAQRGPAASLLTSRPAQYLGAVSYSLYLWHWPVIIIGFSVVAPTTSTRLAALGVALALSVFSYHLIEQPVRHSRWLSRKSGEPRHTSDHGARAGMRVVRVGALSIAAIAVIAVGVYGLYPRFLPSAANASSVGASLAPVPAAPTPSASAAAAIGSAPITIDYTSALRMALSASLQAPEFPPITLEDGWQDVSRATTGEGCTAGVARSSICDFTEAGATKNAVLIGDSQLQAWLPGLRAALAGQGYNLHVFVMPGCTVADVDIYEPYYQSQSFKECTSFRRTALANVTATHPDLTVLTSLWEAYDLRTSGTSGDAATAEWEAGLRSTLATAAAASGRVVLLDSPPTGKSLTDCQTRFATPADCIEHVTADYRHVADMNDKAAAAVAQTGANAHHIGVETWFCVDGSCPAFAVSYPVYADSKHVSPSYGRYVAPLLQQNLVG